jgi:hypothetical protein
VQLRRPDPERRDSLPITNGYRIRCRVRWGQKWYELWTMRCGTPDVDIGEGTVTVELKDDLDLVRRGRRHYVFRKTKRRKHGYFGHEMLRIAARREGIRLGRIVKCKKRMGKVDLWGSFHDLAVKVYTNEREETGRRFLFRMDSRGRFEVVPYKRNALVYVLRDQLRQAAVSKPPKKANPVTILKGKARIGKGDDAKKIRHTEYRREMVRRFGHMEREKDYGRVESRAELRKKMRRDLAEEYKFDTLLRVQHAGIPFVRRGDGAKLPLPSEELTGSRSWVYCTSAQHTVQAGTYTSDFEFNREDPFDADRERYEKFLRERKRKQRKKRKRGDD